MSKPTKPSKPPAKPAKPRRIGPAGVVEPAPIDPRRLTPDERAALATRTAARVLRGKATGGRTSSPRKSPAKAADAARIWHATAPQCRAMRQDGARCRRRAVKGSDMCCGHDGAARAPWCAAAAKRYLAGTLRLDGGRPWPIHPSAK